MHPSAGSSWSSLSASELALLSPAGLAIAASRGRWRLAPHLALLDDALLDVSTGRLRRLIVTMPPRHGKSELCSRYFPAWYLGTYPSRCIILASYEAQFAASWGRKARDVLEEYGPEWFGVRISPTSGAANWWSIDQHGGFMSTAGVGGPITGKGAHVLIIDDPLKNAEQAKSKVQREAQKEWYRSTAYTRLEAEPEGAVVLILTRWHQDDLAGWLLAEALADETADQWTVLNLPALAEQNDPLGRQEGAALWPSRFNAERLDRIRRSLGTYWFSAMYQQRPQPPEGTVFKQQWFRYCAPEERPPTFDLLVQAWDTAWKEGQLNDYSVCVTVGYKNGVAYVLDVLRARMETPALLKAMREQDAKWRPHHIIIEDSAAGTGAYQTLRRETRLPVLLVPADKDKVLRANAVTPYFEDSRVVFVKGSYLPALEDELKEFPLAAHDDQVDALVHALRRVFDRVTERKVARQH